MQTIIASMGATAGIVLIVAGLIAFTNFDFSKLLPIISIVLLGWVITIIITRIIGVSWNQTLIGVIGVTIFTVYLAVDLKMMLGGGRYQYGEDEYVLAALNIFLDIINIFLYMLRFMKSD